MTEEKLTLTQEWDKVFPQNKNVDHRKVTFHNRYGITLAADLYQPKNAEGKLPALAVSGPFGAVKEQSSGLYAQEMAARGFLTIAFDPSFTGESGGAVRDTADPAINSEDFSAAVDFLSVQSNVDPEKIGIIGICGWGGFALNAAAMDTRIRATVTSTMYDMTRVSAKGYFDAVTEDERYAMRQQLAAARTADYRHGAASKPDLSAAVPAEEPPQFVKDYMAYYAPEGRALLRLIEQIEAEWRALSRSAEPASSQVSRRYALGSIVPANPTGDLAALLAQIGIDLFLRHGLRISIASTLAEDLLVGLDTGRFDCILIDAEMSDPGYSLMRLLGGRVAMAGADLPADHDRDALRSALARRPLVLQSRRSGLRQRAEAFLDQFAGEDWRMLGSLIEIDSLPVIVNMVLSGAVVSFLPLHAVAGGGGISVLALPEPFDQRLSLAWRSTPKGRRLAYIIRATLAARGWAENGGVWLPVTDVADPADG